MAHTPPKTLADLARETHKEHGQRAAEREHSPERWQPQQQQQQRGGWEQYQVVELEWRSRQVEERSEEEAPQPITISRLCANEIINFLDSKPSMVFAREQVAQSLREKLEEIRKGHKTQIYVDGETALLLCAISDLLSFKLSDADIREEFAALKARMARLSVQAMRFPSRRYEFTPISANDVKMIRETADQVLGPEGRDLRDKVVRIFEAEVRQPERLVFPILEEAAALERVVARNPQFWDNPFAQDLVKKVMSASGRHVGLPLSSAEAQIITRASDLDTRGALDLLAARARHYAYWGRDERTFTKEDSHKLNRLASKIPQGKHLAAQIQSLTSDYAR